MRTWRWYYMQYTLQYRMVGIQRGIQQQLFSSGGFKGLFNNTEVSLLIMRYKIQLVKTAGLLSLEDLCQVWVNNPENVIIYYSLSWHHFEEDYQQKVWQDLDLKSSRIHMCERSGRTVTSPIGLWTTLFKPWVWHYVSCHLVFLEPEVTMLAHEVGAMA